MFGTDLTVSGFNKSIHYCYICFQSRGRCCFETGNNRGRFTDLICIYNPRKCRSDLYHDRGVVCYTFEIEQFRPYIYGRRFVLVTDHRPLEYGYM